MGQNHFIEKKSWVHVTLLVLNDKKISKYIISTTPPNLKSERCWTTMKISTMTKPYKIAYKSYSYTTVKIFHEC